MPPLLEKVGKSGGQAPFLTCSIFTTEIDSEGKKTTNSKRRKKEQQIENEGKMEQAAMEQVRKGACPRCWRKWGKAGAKPPS